MENALKGKQRSFYLELSSKDCLGNIVLASDSNDGALIEGTIGDIVSLSLVDDVIMEIIGERGALRIELERNEIREMLKMKENKVM